MHSSRKSGQDEWSAMKEDLAEAYGCGSHGTFLKAPITGGDCMVDYQPLKLSSMRVFCLAKGTILKNPVLLMEQLFLTLVFMACAAPVWYYYREDASGDVKLKTFISKQENKMRAFAMIMTGLAAFLLSFYTSIAVGRWWTMRTAGIGAIKAATVDMQMLIHQMVTQDAQVLSAVQRYGRASLMLIFAWRQKDLGNLKEIMVKSKVLTEQESDLLAGRHCLHETIWAWQTCIVTKLHSEGKIKSDQLLALLLQKCTDGRAAAQCIHTHLAVRIPMQYVHLLGFLVKMHNMILAVIMGLLFGAAVRKRMLILAIQLMGRTLILPFLFNAILLVNCDLSDPFNGGEADFPGDIYEVNLGKDCDGMATLTESVPDWLKDKETA